MAEGPKRGRGRRWPLGGAGSILILFFGWIALELVLFAELSDWIGTFQALLVIVLKSGVGLLVLGQWIRWRLRQLRGVTMRTISGQGALEAILTVVGAVFIVVPGLFLAGVGLALVLPPIRSAIARRLIARRPPEDVVDLQREDWREEPGPRLPRME